MNNRRPDNAPPPLLVNAEAAARMLGIGTRKLWSLSNSGRLPVIRIGRAVRYDVRDLVAFIDSLKEEDAK